MKTNLIKTLCIASCSLLFNCGEGSDLNETTEALDSLSSAVPEVILPEEENQVLAFDGVDQGDYKLYGHSEITAEGNESSVQEMFKTLNESGDYEGKIAVTIDEVCKKAGCWITFKNGEEEAVRVFFRDHFTIPTNTLAGTEAILYGQAISDTLTVDFQKHLLDDAAESGEEIKQEEYDAITENKIETTFDCEAILVKKREI